ncbi:MAG TPA: NAD(P)/FAD-dependent oxidoreductase [Nostocaceae cyanobacterium]|nr:NAD(P)/FAD-dependent oxidoreductase [Nostocaceae cyanobacterium]
MVKKVVIIGAGPSGVLLAHYLLRRGDQYQVDIYEGRSDPRIVSFSQSRTFPISLGDRGIKVLQQIPQLGEAIKPVSTEIKGTIVHRKNGKTQATQRQKPLIALDRSNLAKVLLDKLVENYDQSRLNINFNCRCVKVDFAAKQAKLHKINVDNPTEIETEFTIDYDLLIGADGAKSVVRENLSNLDEFEFEQEYVVNGYKSIFLSNPTAIPEINLQKGKLHTWRIDAGVTILLLYQPDGKMNGVVLFPYAKNPIAELKNTEQVLRFFRDNFPEVGQLMLESEAEEFAQKPISRITTVRCNRYHQGDSVLLIGDAAHSVSASIAQGCNSALEDVLVFNQLLDEYADNLELALEQYSIRRKPDADALRELSDYSFPLSKGLFIEFLIRQYSAKFLNKLFPQKFSPPLLEVVFESTIPYREVYRNYQGWLNKVKKSNAKYLIN